MSTDELAHWGEFVEGVSGALTILAAAIGGFFGLRRYRKQVKLRGAELLLKLEIEFRQSLASARKSWHILCWR
jgi:hypothetical protein